MKEKKKNDNKAIKGDRQNERAIVLVDEFECTEKKLWCKYR